MRFPGNLGLYSLPTKKHLQVILFGFPGTIRYVNLLQSRPDRTYCEMEKAFRRHIYQEYLITRLVAIESNNSKLAEGQDQIV